MCSLSEGVAERAAERATKKHIINMYKNGSSLDYIATVVELTVDEVKTIIDEENAVLV
jgi:arsenate reductase-like glutaredoxin family protein